MTASGCDERTASATDVSTSFAVSCPRLERTSTVPMEVVATDDCACAVPGEGVTMATSTPTRRVIPRPKRARDDTDEDGCEIYEEEPESD